MTDRILPTKDIDQDELEEVVRLRRHFHQRPELAFTEFWTTREICQYLQGLGYSIQYGKDLYKNAYPSVQHISELAALDANLVDEAYTQVTSEYPNDPWLEQMQGGFTGLIATLDSEVSGPTVGFRFDIDGLPIKESAESSHLPSSNSFTSSNENMHACGHDGHTSIGLALAKQISEQIDQLTGRFVLVFQPAEEGPSGGKVFAQFSVFQQLDYFVALHVGILDARRIVCGLSFLSLKSFTVRFKGTNAHAAVSPELGRNALLAACSAVTNIFAISRHSDGVSRMNVGQFHSDNPANVISGLAEFELELRGQSNEICDFLYQRAQDVLQGIALAYGVEVEMEPLGEYVMAENGAASVQLMKQAVLDAGVPEELITDYELTPGSEDATFMMNEVNRSGGSASYLCLGSQTFGGHHHPEFNFDEDMLLYGVDILWRYIQRVNESEK